MHVMIMLLLADLTAKMYQVQFRLSRVGKYHDIFENIKIPKISKISWYIWHFR